MKGTTAAIAITETNNSTTRPGRFSRIRVNRSPRFTENRSATRSTRVYVYYDAVYFLARTLNGIRIIIRPPSAPAPRETKPHSVYFTWSIPSMNVVLKLWSV